MDIAVQLVQTYLHINGYFTVTEYPVLEAMQHGGVRTATDLDVLAIRFPGAGRAVAPPKRGRRAAAEIQAEPDRELGGAIDGVDMIVGEVKEGRAVLNPAARDPAVIGAALTRFGCCPQEHVERVVEELLRKGMSRMPSGHAIRFVAFGSNTGEPLGYPCTVVSLGHILRFCREYVREHWDLLRHAQFKDDALAFLMLLEKS